MAIKSFEIPYNGGKGTLEIETKPKAGTVLKIEELALKGNAAGTLMQPNIQEYLVALATNLIVKAPWGDTKSVTAFMDLDYDTFNEVRRILGEEFPLVDFLSPRARTMYGKKFDGLELDSQTESTLNASNSDSRSDK